MFHLFLLFASLTSYATTPIITTDTIPLPPGSPSIANVVQVFASPTSNAASSAVTDAVLTQQQITKTDITIDYKAVLKSYVAPCVDAMHASAQQIPGLWEQLKVLCWEHKWQLSAYTVLACYAKIGSDLIRDHFYLNDANLWAYWKHDQALTTLCALNPQELHKELIIAIQQRYLDPQNPTNSIRPLTQFLIAIEQEKKRIEQYCTRAKWLKRLRLARFFLLSGQKIASISALLERVNFVHALFSAWASEHNWDTLTDYLNQTRKSISLDASPRKTKRGYV